MKIKTKLALIYTSITVGILMIVFVFVFILTSRTIDNNYYALLFEKALLTAQMHFEKDELNQLAYQKILDAYENLLPETSEIVITADDKEETILKLKNYISDNQIYNLFGEKKIKFEQHEMNGVGIYYPDNEGNFIILVTAHNTQGEYIKAMLKNILLVILLISSILIFGLLWWNAKLITKPLNQMVASMQKITAKELYLRVPKRKGNDELAQVINYFNQMIERLEIGFNLQKDFISNASHELKNPLTAIMGDCEVMQLKEFSPKEYRESIQRIEFETNRLNSLINNLLKLAQTDLDISESDKEKLNIQDEIQSVVQYFKSTKYAGRIHFEHENNPFFIEANKHLLFVALQNVIENACKYSTEQVVVKTNLLKSGFEILIIDKGIGIPSAEKDKIFDAFYRAGNSYGYKGSGIGLSLVHKILDLSNAKINVDSTESLGTTVKIWWEI